MAPRDLRSRVSSWELLTNGTVPGLGVAGKPGGRGAWVHDGAWEALNMSAGGILPCTSQLGLCDLHLHGHDASSRLKGCWEHEMPLSMQRAVSAVRTP